MTIEEIRYELLFGEGKNEQFKNAYTAAYKHKDTDPDARRFYELCERILKENTDPFVAERTPDRDEIDLP